MSVEDEANAVGDYWDGHPVPPEEPVSGAAQAAYDAAKAAWEAGFGEGGPPEPPAPPTIPGPPAPGAGMPAARLGDLCAHGGAITGPCCATVIIGNMPAARIGDQAACPMFDVLIPHATGTIVQGSPTVLIGNMPAARVADSVGPPTNCKGNAIALGCFTVLIGG